MEKIRDFGREKSGSDHYLTKGWNFKFTDFQAVIGIEQMKKLPNRVQRKKEMGQLYHSLLRDVPQIELIPTNFEETVPWFFDVLCDRRSEIKEYLRENSIGTREFYPPLHSEPAYGYTGYYPVTEEVAEKGLWLPSSIKVKDEEIAYICEKIKAFYGRK